jgi:diguanylate cyclase (GGDEF)-like protein/PAS domain S-box-containing protein
MNQKSFQNLSKAELVAQIAALTLRMEELEATQAECQRVVERMFEKGEVYRTLLDESSDPIFMFDPEGTYRYVNRAFAEGVGRAQDQIIGYKISDVFSAEEAEKRFTVMKWVFEHGETRVFEVRVPRPDGDRYYITTVKPILTEQKQVTSVICISKEITDRKKIERELQLLSTHDALTGLYNRHFFHAELERIAGSRLYPVCIVMMDLDNLKVINDSLGHKAGDAYLQNAAELLKKCFRSEDVVARIGGDEFVALLPETTQPQLMSILTRLKREIKSQGNPMFNLSLGWAIGEQDSNLDEVMQQADLRMYREKILHRK